MKKDKPWKYRNNLKFFLFYRVIVNFCIFSVHYSVIFFCPVIAFLLFWITKKKCDGTLSTLSWLFQWDVTVLLWRRYCQTNPAFPSAGLHAFGLMDRVLWIVTEFSMFNQYGSDLRMIFFVNDNTILQFFFSILNIFLFTADPLPYDFIGKQGPAIICFCHHLCIFWKVWDPQAQWSFLFETSAE